MIFTKKKKTEMTEQGNYTEFKYRSYLIVSCLDLTAHSNVVFYIQVSVNTVADSAWVNSRICTSAWGN